MNNGNSQNDVDPSSNNQAQDRGQHVSCSRQRRLRSLSRTAIVGAGYSAGFGGACFREAGGHSDC